MKEYKELSGRVLPREMDVERPPVELPGSMGDGKDVDKGPVLRFVAEGEAGGEMWDG